MAIETRAYVATSRIGVFITEFLARFGVIVASTGITTPTVLTNVYTVATLPTGMARGTQAVVSDATSPTYLGALTGGGAVVAPVMYTGTEWVSC